ncbi:hypothetical protein J7K06_02255 [Candidatus Bathyarchaeota archaeon]|nr:hypothetical protein [Candidatus Bathyarchaeota archaeon]
MRKERKEKKKGNLYVNKSWLMNDRFTTLSKEILTEKRFLNVMMAGIRKYHSAKETV